MTHLTPNQIELLRAAAGADDGAVEATDDAKAVRALINRGLLIALPQAEGPSRLIITEAGRAAVEAPPAPTLEPDRASEFEHPTPETVTPAATPKGKLGILVALLRGSDGATVAAMAAATGWQHHSVRGAMSGGLKKKLGYEIASEKTEAGRVYRLSRGGRA
jgi:hypothetical protein